MTEPPQDTRVAQAEEKGWSGSWTNYNNEHTWNVLDALFQVVEEAGKMPAQTAINWLLQQQGVTSPIIDVRTMEQLEANFGAIGWSLTGNQLSTLNNASRMPISYPYDIRAEQQQRSGRL